MATKASVVILSGPEDWHHWIKVIERAARSADVWDYINPSYERSAQPAQSALPATAIPLPGDEPSNEAPNPPLNRPVMPTPGMVKEDATTLLNFSKGKVKEYRRLEFVHEFQMYEYYANREAIAEILQVIEQTITMDVRNYITGCYTVRDILARLKERMAPTDYEVWALNYSLNRSRHISGRKPRRTRGGMR